MSKKLLLADDSVTIQKVVGITFSGGGYELAAVGDGDSALEKARVERPDLILADVCMPGKNGYELCEAVKEDPALRGIPVLLLTGTFEPFDESKATQAGADGWVTKPFESQMLIKNVEELLARAATTPRVEAAVAMEEISEPANPVQDIWADLATLDLPEETESPPLIKDEDGQAADVAAADIWGTLEPEPASVQDPAPDLGTEEAGAIRDDGYFAGEESRNSIGLEEFDKEDDEEILLLSDSDIIEDEEVFEGQVESSEIDPAWFQEEPASKSSAVENPPEREPHPSNGEDDPLAEEYEEFSLDGFEDPEMDELDLSEFEVELDESIEPLENSSPAASQEDPFQIGADDFWTAQAELAESQGDSVWDKEEESPGRAVKHAATEDIPPAAKLSLEARAAAISEEEIARIVEKVAGSVVERLAQTMLERIAWEVVPDLAETMIKEEIRKIREEVK